MCNNEGMPFIPVIAQKSSLIASIRKGLALIWIAVLIMVEHPSESILSRFLYILSLSSSKDAQMQLTDSCLEEMEDKFLSPPVGLPFLLVDSLSIVIVCYFGIGRFLVR